MAACSECANRVEELRQYLSETSANLVVERAAFERLKKVNLELVEANEKLIEQVATWKSLAEMWRQERDKLAEVNRDLLTELGEGKP